MDSGGKLLYLASGSESRQRLLTEAQIPFRVIGHQCDERAVEAELDEGEDVRVVVRHLAVCKARHADFTAVAGTGPIFLLSADTMISGKSGHIFGKPQDYDHAVEMIKMMRDGADISTGFCCQRLLNVSGKWEIAEEFVDVISAYFQLAMPDHLIPYYLAHDPEFTHKAGGLAVEEFGAQFTRRIEGSYSTILGLPMVEVREALEKLGFFEMNS